MPQELTAVTRWKQLVEGARTAEEESDGREPHAQVSETYGNPAEAASFYKAFLPTRQPSQLEITATKLYHITGHSEKGTLREAEADSNFAVGYWVRGLPCVSPSEGFQIHCPSCKSNTQLIRSYACTQCLRGICQTCVTRLMAKKWKKRRCPWCHTDGAQFKPND
ncbi:hypothetical protein BKA64DRAFT_706506 [Cadophora sp. MPI-SDFR-AT-0126]|nr:hypothetical protein BKA64DRAFT_706506 [Leotiomycetes sp. MPI-SDFR-AT-0126]